jgi:hypothetical protein
MASEAEKRELATKLDALVKRRFGPGGWAAAHKSFDTDHDGKISAGELERLLEEADVGNMVTRSVWVSGVLEELDKDRDQGVSLAELQKVLPGQTTAKAPTAVAGVSADSKRPAWLFPLNMTPAKKTPAKKTPAKKTPAKKTPAPEETGADWTWPALGVFAGVFLIWKLWR